MDQQVFRVSGFGIGISGFWFLVSGFGFRISGFGLLSSFGFRASVKLRDLGFCQLLDFGLRSSFWFLVSSFGLRGSGSPPVRRRTKSPCSV